MHKSIKMLFAALAALLLFPGMLFGYNVGADDVLSITVVGMDDISGNYRVSPDGTVSFPMAGEIVAKGKTLEEIKAELTDKLSKRLKNPEIYVNIETPTNDNVFVIGPFSKSGVYTFKTGMGLAEIVARAASVEKLDEFQSAGDIFVEVKSTDGSLYKTPYDDVLSSDYLLKNGDIIRIDMENAVNVNVIGSVKNQGFKRLAGKTGNLVTAIAAAGGFAETADIAHVKVYAPDGSLKIADFTQTVLAGGEGAALENIVLADNSTIIVPEYNLGITVVGWVKKPGFFRIKPGETYRLTEAIAMAGGGVENMARYNEIAVIGPKGTEEDTKVYNYNKYVKLQDMTQNPFVRPGDVVFVPCTRAIDWKTVISTLSNVVRTVRDVDDVLD
ncbi:MAG: polysaccharide biosynthesis/export family protein [Abditibacteriota bacterium]|nr:polysaccharide biosynthesis/export family protein [Abditibacteriota bacterium]